MKRLLKAFALFLLITALVSAALLGLFLMPKTMPAQEELAELQSGDLIFQSHDTPQALPVSLATGSRYSHVGIIIRKPGEAFYVLDSAGRVGEQPLAEWVKQGHGQQFAVYRDQRLSDDQRSAFLEAATPHLGKGYDFLFWFDNEELYCSELPYLMYQSINMPIGKIQRIGELNVDNFLVEGLIRERWQRHPRCKGDHGTYEACRELVLNQTLISPASLAEDPNMQLVYSNYLF